MGEMVLSSASQIPQLKNIWMSCFPEDSREMVDLFFHLVYKPSECLVRIEEGIPVSMVFMLPAVWKYDNIQWPVQYIYAAATHPQWQNRGYFGELLQQAIRIAGKRGQKASFLRPGEESLFAYYQRFGYKPYFFREYICEQIPSPILHADNTGNIIHEISYGEFTAVRDKVLSSVFSASCSRSVWIQWEKRLAGYAARSAILSGGGILCSPQGYAIYEADADGITVKELVCPKEERQAYRDYFSNLYPGKTIHISLPAQDKERAQPFGVWLPLDTGWISQVGETGIPYMGLALD